MLNKVATFNPLRKKSIILKQKSFNYLISEQFVGT